MTTFAHDLRSSHPPSEPSPQSLGDFPPEDGRVNFGHSAQVDVGPEEASAFPALPSTHDPSETTEPEPPNDGRFKAGQPGPALKTGAYSQLIRSGEYAGSRELLAEARAELYAELGGDLPAVKRSMVDAFIELGAVRDYLGGRLAVEGPLTAKGYTRALLTAYLSVIDRQVKLAQLLGLERRVKRVDSIDELMHEHAESK